MADADFLVKYSQCEEGDVEDFFGSGDLPPPNLFYQKLHYRYRWRPNAIHSFIDYVVKKNMQKIW